MLYFGLMSSSDMKPARKRISKGGPAVTEENIAKILGVAAGSIRKIVESGFGQTTVVISVRHGSICEAKIEDKETTTIAL